MRDGHGDRIKQAACRCAGNGELAVVVEDGTFAWSASKPVLDSMNLKVSLWLIRCKRMAQPALPLIDAWVDSGQGRRACCCGRRGWERQEHPAAGNPGRGNSSKAPDVQVSPTAAEADTRACSSAVAG